MQTLDLVHHRFVDGQSPGGVDQQDIVVMPFGPVDGSGGNRFRLFASAGREEIHAGLTGDGLQLFDGSRAINVAGYDQHFFLVVFLEELAQFADGGRLASPLQTGHEDDGRRLGVEVDALVCIAHQAGQFAVHDANQRLPRIERTNDFLADSLVLDGGDEILDHRQGDVGLEQRHAYFAQGIGDVGFSQSGFALERLHDAGQARGQVVEHVRWASSRIAEWSIL